MSDPYGNPRGRGEVNHRVTADGAATGIDVIGMTLYNLFFSTAAHHVGWVSSRCAPHGLLHFQTPPAIRDLPAARVGLEKCIERRNGSREVGRGDDKPVRRGPVFLSA